VLTRQLRLNADGAHDLAFLLLMASECLLQLGQEGDCLGENAHEPAVGADRFNQVLRQLLARQCCDHIINATGRLARDQNSDQLLGRL
jgi:hypothetical protein